MPFYDDGLYPDRFYSKQMEEKTKKLCLPIVVASKRLSRRYGTKTSESRITDTDHDLEEALWSGLR